jgi:hypothetical protein
MFILIDTPEQRSRLIENIRRRMGEEIEEVALIICEGKSAERSLRRLQTLTKLLTSIEVATAPSRLLSWRTVGRGSA